MLTHFFSGATFPAGPAGVFVFFAAAPPGRSLAHCGPGRRCLPPGWCFVFAAAPPGSAWWLFFAVAPPGRSLTHCGLGRFRHGPGGVLVDFFLLWPRAGAQRASPSPAFRRGRSQKKNTLGGVFFVCSGPAERSRRPTERNK